MPLEAHTRCGTSLPCTTTYNHQNWQMSMKNHPNRKRIRRRETSKCNQISWPGENSSPWRFSQHLPASLIISQSHRGFSFQVAVHSKVQRAGVSCLEPGAQEMARLGKIFQTNYDPARVLTDSSFNAQAQFCPSLALSSSKGTSSTCQSKRCMFLCIYIYIC